MFSEYSLLVYMFIFDAIMGITVPVEFALHEIRYRRELRERGMNGTSSIAPQRPSMRWPFVVVLCAGLTSTFAFLIYMQRPLSIPESADALSNAKAQQAAEDEGKISALEADIRVATSARQTAQGELATAQQTISDLTAQLNALYQKAQ